MKILWLEAAVLDLESPHAFISQDRPRAASTEVETVLAAVQNLADFPSAGRSGRVQGTRELVVSTWVIAYRVKHGAVQVLRVLHAARQWPERLR